jgi:hypothetical protein
MHTIEAFFRETWSTFIIVTPVMVLLQFGRRVSLEGTAAVLVRPRSFRELCAFSREEQRRLFRDADREAFPRWRFYLPVLIYAAVFTSGTAGATTLSDILCFPDSVWMRAGLAGLVVALPGWLASRLEAHCIRPFLKYQIERTHHAT